MPGVLGKCTVIPAAHTLVTLSGVLVNDAHQRGASTGSLSSSSSSEKREFGVIWYFFCEAPIKRSSYFPDPSVPLVFLIVIL